jgi:hypothetical protein
MDGEYGRLDSDYVFVNLWGGVIGALMKYSAVDKLVARTEKRVGFEFTAQHVRDGAAAPPRSPGDGEQARHAQVDHDDRRHLLAPRRRGPASRAGRGGLALAGGGGVTARALHAVPACEEQRPATFEALVRPEFRVDLYLPPRDNAWLYGPHCSVEGCERPGNELIVDHARLCQRHA